MKLRYSLYKRLHLRFLIPLVLSLAAGWLWRENVGLRAQLAVLRARDVSERTGQRSSLTLPPADIPHQSQGMKIPEPIPESIDTETSGEEAQVLETVKNEIVVSFGPIEQLGAQASQFFASHEAARLRRQASALGQELPPQTPEELLADQRQAVEFLGALPEIVDFQNQPDEYGRFFRGLFETGGALSTEDADKVERLMKSRAEELIRQGLNEGNKPADGAIAWEWKRDSFHEETAAQLNAILPDEAKQRFPISSSLMEFLEMDFDKSDLTLPALQK
ncbi:MAG: hypothetical protein KDN22_08615 [Verrucomicrobiae bacterium]|nr:hypothetical protein [Verrucomicrobiae bacterium]